MNQPEEKSLKALREDLFIKRDAAEKAAYAYFCALPIGQERTAAHEIYQNIRLATRV